MTPVISGEIQKLFSQIGKYHGEVPHQFQIHWRASPIKTITLLHPPSWILWYFGTKIKLILLPHQFVLLIIFHCQLGTTNIYINTKEGKIRQNTNNPLLSLSVRCGPAKICVVHWSLLCPYLYRCTLHWFPFERDSCGTFGVVVVAPVHQLGAVPACAAAGSRHAWWIYHVIVK